ncbi:MAG: hypothetical protein HY718_14285 [Planctomycetes bacterium]|nr:hypothetical protein [Planctomycetota bacterium]
MGDAGGNGVSEPTRQVRLGDIAVARSGDKGDSANIGVIARTPAAYDLLRDRLTAQAVERYFAATGVVGVVRYELPNLGALNFILPGALAGGGSRSLRIDAQGKALGQALLEMVIDLPDERDGRDAER